MQGSEAMQTYEIKTTDGSQDRRLSYAYESFEEALAAARAVLGWDEVYVSDEFATTGALSPLDRSSEWLLYQSREQYDADWDGAYAPRIVRTTHS